MRLELKRISHFIMTFKKSDNCFKVIVNNLLDLIKF